MEKIESNEDEYVYALNALAKELMQLNQPSTRDTVKTLFSKSSARGSSFGFLGIGCLYESGFMGSPRDSKMAVQYFDQAVHANGDDDGASLFKLGKCYMNGAGCEVNVHTAMKLFERGSEHNSGCAIALGEIYQFGNSVAHEARTAHSAQRTAQSAQRTTHSAKRTTQSAHNAHSARVCF